MRLAFLSIGRHLHTERWIGWFVARGHDCHLLTVQPGPIEGVTIHDIRRDAPGKPLRYWRSLGEVKRVLGEIKPDVLNTHFLTGYGYWGDFSGFRPNVVTVWGDDVYVTPHENGLKKWLAQRALRHADFVTGDSKDILRGCVELGAAADRCYEILWGVDFERFRPDRPQRIREELGIEPEALVVFSPRSFSQPYYNIDVIIESCVRLRSQRPDVHVIFAGYEGDQTPFVQRAQEAGLDRNTHFVGRIPHDRFGEYLVASDIFVSVPSVDATAVSLLEAMACGTAIIVSSLASSTEWIEDGIRGRVVEPRNVQQLTDALFDLVSDEELRRRLGAAALERARRRADHGQNMERAEVLYEYLAQGKEIPPHVLPLSVAASHAC